jgi:two-component system, chemotaxis family, sensor kinase Cph1
VATRKRRGRRGFLDAYVDVTEQRNSEPQLERYAPGTARDITDPLALEAALQSKTAELERARIRLEASHADLERFAAVASRDLQEPLRVVTGFLELLERRYGDRLDDDGMQFVGAALSGARRMQRLIRGLLDICALGRDEPRYETIDTAELVAEVVRDLRPAIEAMSATVVTGELPVVRADPDQLRRLLETLVANAIRLCEEERPQVLVAGHELSAERWELSVTDNAVGIDPDRAFELLGGLDTGEAHEGTGVGLAVCRRIVERHGGSIRVESVAPRGNRFVFTLAAPA